MKRKAAKEAADLLLRNPNLNIDKLKKEISAKHGVPILRNSEILKEIPLRKRSIELMNVLRLRSVRTISGIANIAVMSKPMPCPGKCIYCPGGTESPKSYTGDEPAAMRGAQNDFDPYRQVRARVGQLREIGHSVDKCELIIMGGTFNAQSKRYQRAFMKGCFDALNNKKSKSLLEAQRLNEKAKSRAVGITFETRPDFSKKDHINSMLDLGATRIELGVQTLSNRVYKKVQRGHSVEDVAEATALCRDSALKVGYHIMPGLFSTPVNDVLMFKKLFSDPRFKPDMLKIYPCMVVKGTELYEMWKRGDYEPYDTATASEVLAQATRFIPTYVRVMRVQRDIPKKRIEAGVMHSNLRQIVEAKLLERGESCSCIRCREMGLKSLKLGIEPDAEDAKLCKIKYNASGGKEFFLSYESGNGLFGFLRLRIPKAPFRPELNSKTALIRELHVYGEALGIGKAPGKEFQHRGFGKRLLENAEKIARKSNCEKLVVMSGIGVRQYYYNRGYKKDGVYVSKIL